MNMVHHYNRRRRKKESAAEFVSRMNSYLGMMKHYDTEEQRSRIVGNISKCWWKYVSVGDGNLKLIDKYPRRTRIKRELRTERRMFNNLKYSIGL